MPLPQSPSGVLQIVFSFAAVHTGFSSRIRLVQINVNSGYEIQLNMCKWLQSFQHLTVGSV